MKSKILNKAIAAFVMVAILYAVYALATIKKRGEITLGVTPVDSAIMSNDRYVFAGGEGGIDVIDAAVFDVVSTLTINDIVALGINPNNSYLYSLDADGIIQLYSLGDFGISNDPGESVALEAAYSVDLDTSASVGDVAMGAIPNYESSNSVYIFVSIPADKKVEIYRQADLIGGSSTAFGELNLSGVPKKLLYKKVNTQYALIVSEIDSASSIPLLEIFNASNSFNRDDQLIPSGAEADDELGGMAISADGDLIALGNATKKKIHLIDVNIDASSVFYLDDYSPSSVSLNAAPTALSWVETSEADYFYAATDDSRATFIDYDNLSDTAPDSISLDGAGTIADISAATSTDDYAYLFDSPNGAALVVTHNPWISDLQFSPSSVNNGESSTSVTFTSASSGSIEVRRGGDIRGTSGTILIAYSEKKAENGSNTFKISPDDLSEGDNNIYIFVKNSSGYVGRLGFAMTKDSTPAAPEFHLNFGDKSIYVYFQALKVSDIDSYQIYYKGYDDKDAETPSSTYTAASSVEKIEKGDFSTGKENKFIIKKLVNGVKYYVSIRAVDESGNVGKLSDIKSETPQATQSLTEAKGDSGSCSAIPVGAKADARGAAILWAIWGFVFLAIRYRIKKSRKTS